MLKDLRLNSQMYRRVYKNYLRFIQPMTNAIYNRQVSRFRAQRLPSENLDLIITDQRDQFTATTDQIRHISLRILRCFDYLSQKHNFQYFLAYGSLLGAVRHQGFIPWDDDLDIMMLPQDFSRFKQICTELPESLHLVRRDRGFWKVMDRHSIISKDGRRGIALDIFVAETYHDHFFFTNVHNQQPILFSTSDLLPLQKLAFERELQLPCPANPAFFLKALYGDFMQLPPESERVFPHLGSKVKIGTFGGPPLN